MDARLLTIAVPTYNRAKYLDICLDSICSQLQDSFNIELIVSNNASTDNTAAIVQKYIDKGFKINYVVQTENVGADGNFVGCFNLAKGKYFWIIGDDDFLVPGALRFIVELLANNECGVARVIARGYQQYEVVKKEELPAKLQITKYDDSMEFFKAYHFWATFISGCIINRSLVAGKIDPYEYSNTSLIQLGWSIPAAFMLNTNIVVQTPLIVAKDNNTGGYGLIKVFDENYTNVLQSFVKKGYDKQIVSITNTNLNKGFFPTCVSLLMEKKNNFKKEEHFFTLLKSRGKSFSYWAYIFPVYIKGIIKNTFPFLKKLRNKRVINKATL